MYGVENWTSPRYFWLENDRYGFLRADTDADISTIHRPIADTDNQYFQNF